MNQYYTENHERKRQAWAVSWNMKGKSVLYVMLDGNSIINYITVLLCLHCHEASKRKGCRASSWINTAANLDWHSSFVKRWMTICWYCFQSLPPQKCIKQQILLNTFFTRHIGCYLEMPRHRRYCHPSVWPPGALKMIKEVEEVFVLNCNCSVICFSLALFSLLPTILKAPWGQVLCLYHSLLHSQCFFKCLFLVSILTLTKYFWMSESIRSPFPQILNKNV